MINYAVGEDIFKKSLHNYLDNNKFSTGKPEYLWSALQMNINQIEGINETIFTLMDSWASQAGHPVVHAFVTAGLLILTQVIVFFFYCFYLFFAYEACTFKFTKLCL